MLQRQIRMRRIDDYIMDLAIIANPHKKAEDQKEFIDDLMNQRRFMRPEPEAPPELDVEAFQRFKSDLSKESILLKVK